MSKKFNTNANMEKVVMAINAIREDTDMVRNIGECVVPVGGHDCEPIQDLLYKAAANIDKLCARLDELFIMLKDIGEKEFITYTYDGDVEFEISFIREGGDMVRYIADLVPEDFDCKDSVQELLKMAARAIYGDCDDLEELLWLDVEDAEEEEA